MYCHGGDEGVTWGVPTKDFPSSHVEKRVRPWKPSRWFGGRRSQGGVRDVTRVEKNEMIFLMLENLLGPSVTSGNVGPDRVSRWASHFLFFSLEK